MAYTQRFQYQPLHGPHNMRLMWLDPARSLAAPLHCRLVEVCLDDNPQYECLSYSCEKQNGFGNIFIFNILSEITRNCEAALRRLRYENQPRVLWVDSICINQDPKAIPERSQQIMLMREIYQRAVEVQVWLGEVNTPASRGYMIALAREEPKPWKVKFGTKSERQDAMLLFMVNSLVFIITEAVLKPMLMLRTRIPTSKKNSMVGKQHPMFQFFSSTVFERMWCVQEVVVGRSVRLMQGSSILKWEQLVKKLKEMSRLKGRDIIFTQCSQRLALQEMLRNVINPQPNRTVTRWPPLSSLLDATRHRGSEWPHDKVYSLWGIFMLMGIRLSDPDYTKSVRLVYQEVVLASFTVDQNLNILYQVTALTNPHNLPSWVPDLSNTKAPPTIMYEAYHASGNSPLRWQLARDSNELWLSGTVVDCIKLCGDALRSSNESTSQQHGPLAEDGETYAAAETFKRWLAMANGLGHYPTGQSITDAFGLTMVTNNVVLTEKKLPQFLDVYKSWSQIFIESTSGKLLLEKGVDNMIDDIASLPVDAHQKQEFALQIAVALLACVIVSPVTSGKKTRAFHHWLHLSLRRRKFFVTERGYMGLAPASALVGDDVVLLSGMRTPFLKREGPFNNTSQLVAPVYIEGMMAGELWNQNERLDRFAFV